MDNEKKPETKNLEKSVIDIIEKMVHYIDTQDAKEDKKWLHHHKLQMLQEGNY